VHLRKSKLVSLDDTPDALALGDFDFPPFELDPALLARCFHRMNSFLFVAMVYWQRYYYTTSGGGSKQQEKL
jgi:hypothetical protein